MTNSSAVSHKLLVHVCQLGPHPVLVQKGFLKHGKLYKDCPHPKESSLDRKIGAMGVILIQ